MKSSFLHEDILNNSFMGERIIKPRLEKQIGRLAMEVEGLVDPGVSIVIRSRNNVEQLEALFEDIKNQNYTGQVETILVDTESTDGTVELARRFGAEVIGITQHDFNYPLALNKGFEAASHDWVFSFVDHSLLSNTEVLHAATRAEHRDGDIAGVSGIILPNRNATRIERIGTEVSVLPRLKQGSVYELKKARMGDLAANASVYHLDAWHELGGFDEAYGAGGEDTVFARAALEAGLTLMMDPAISVHHSHGVGLVEGVEQLGHWNRIMQEPLPFDRPKLEKFRSDLT